MKIIALTKFNLKKILKDKGIYFWNFLFPLLFTMLFISFLTSGLNHTQKADFLQFLIPAYVVMFSFFMMISMAETYLQDVKDGWIARFLTTDVSFFSYSIGKTIPFLIVLLLQTAMLLTLGLTVYDVTIYAPLQFLLICLLLNFVVLTLGVFIAMNVSTINMAVALTQIFALGGAMLSGLWMPVDMLPTFMQKAGEFFPQYWAHQALLETMVEGGNSQKIFTSSILLLTYSFVFLLLIRLRKKAFQLKAVSLH